MILGPFQLDWVFGEKLEIESAAQQFLHNPHPVPTALTRISLTDIVGGRTEIWAIGIV